MTAAHCGACGDYTVPFDHLVLALGSVPNYFGLPGVAEHALTIKSLADATALHAHMIDKLEHADLQPDPAIRRQLLTFVVAGGGFAGVETLAELNDFVRGAGPVLSSYFAGRGPHDLIHSGDRILPEVSQSLSQYALNKLRESRRRGIVKDASKGVHGGHDSTHERRRNCHAHVCLGRRHRAQPGA